jgi:hypothetical protein
MRFINTVTNVYPVHEGDIRLLHPDMGVNFILPPEYAPIEIDESDIAEPRENCKIVTSPVELIDGKYKQKMVFVQLTELEIQQNADERARWLALQYTNPNTEVSGGAPNVIG